MLLFVPLLIFLNISAQTFSLLHQPMATNVSLADLPNLHKYYSFNFTDGHVLTQFAYQTSAYVSKEGLYYTTVAPIVISLSNLDNTSFFAWAVSYSQSKEYPSSWSSSLQQAYRYQQDAHKTIQAVKNQFLLTSSAEVDRTTLTWVRKMRKWFPSFPILIDATGSECNSAASQRKEVDEHVAHCVVYSASWCAVCASAPCCHYGCINL